MDKTPRICNSAGHGLGSRTAGQVDPGADVLAPYSSEAALVLAFCKRLDADFAALFRGVPGSHHMLRNSGVFFRADDEAAAHACDTFIEWHTNATTRRARRDGREVGVEVLFHDYADKPFAVALSREIAVALGLPNRGVRYRGDLAVLRPHRYMTQVLVELFFGSDGDDVAAWTAHHEAAELAAVNVCLDKWGWRRVKRLPRTWGVVSRAFYAANRYRR